MECYTTPDSEDGEIAHRVLLAVSSPLLLSSWSEEVQEMSNQLRLQLRFNLDKLDYEIIPTKEKTKLLLTTTKVLNRSSVL